ncbi:M20/M25/M40 family metallo-hydrolase [Ornithinimicrobium panacihumi]|uniref:M20/M25/M40 family metallo-hydrolase n=1 Tax=Ornithinimicrobium panacihumi TaxID=2008449 RepID=UPI003F8A5192
MASPHQHRAVSSLQALVQVPSVSHPDPALVDTAAFDQLLDVLRERYPLIHERLEVTRHSGHALLIRWAGSSSDRPVVLMAHLDVVPVEGQGGWTHPPFGAEIHDGMVHGRGTLDDKGQLVTICEAVEGLLADGFVPAQDVWLSFGCDEEVSGGSAPEAVRLLRERGVRPWFVLDEGGAVAHGAFPGVRAPVAVVGVAEKGTTDVRLVAQGRGGHASTPARRGPTWRIARAIQRIEAHPMPASLPDATVELLTRLAPHLPAPLRSLMSRADRLRPALTRALLAAGPEPAAMARTTVAATTLRGSPAHNVIATRAEAGLNIRVAVTDTVEDVLTHLRRTVKDPEVSIEVLDAGAPSPVSPYLDEPAFDLITGAVEEVFPDAIVSPYVMMAATDSRHFTAICDRVYRFAPLRMTKEQRESIHSYDERVGCQDLVDGVAWTRLLLERLPR